MTLPNVLNYNEAMPSLPDGSKKTNIVLNPSNSQSTYTAGNMIMFDLPKQRYMNPESKIQDGR